MAGKSTLKVYAIHDGTVEKMVATTNRAAAAALMGCTDSGLKSWGRSVIDVGTVAIAISEPGTVFYSNMHDHLHPRRQHRTYEAAKVRP